MRWRELSMRLWRCRPKRARRACGTCVRWSRKITSIAGRAALSASWPPSGWKRPAKPPGFLLELAQRIAHHDVLPAQGGDRQIVALRQVAAVEISRQEIVRVRRKFQEGLVDMAGTAGRAFVYVIGGERLGRACEPVAYVLPVADLPGSRRPLERAAVA